MTRSLTMVETRWHEALPAATFAGIDVETTGLDSRSDRVVSYRRAAARSVATGRAPPLRRNHWRIARDDRVPDNVVLFPRVDGFDRMDGLRGTFDGSACSCERGQRVFVGGEIERIYITHGIQISRRDMMEIETSRTRRRETTTRLRAVTIRSVFSLA